MYDGDGELFGRLGVLFALALFILSRVSGLVGLGWVQLGWVVACLGVRLFASRL